MMIFVLSCCDCLCVTLFDKFDKFDNLDILDNFGVCPRIDFGDPPSSKFYKTRLAMKVCACASMEPIRVSET